MAGYSVCFHHLWQIFLNKIYFSAFGQLKCIKHLEGNMLEGHWGYKDKDKFSLNSSQVMETDKKWLLYKNHKKMYSLSTTKEDGRSK